jgi:hypothetical protein
MNNLTRWTMLEYYAGDTWPDYYLAGVGQSRDSDCLEQSNFATMLHLLGGESETIIVVHEGHWAVGWVEWIAIHETDDEAMQIADAAQERLQDYPVLDEDDWNEREQEAASETWKNCYSERERIEYIRKHRDQFEFHDYADLLGCVRGEYFTGYASDLLHT